MNVKRRDFMKICGATSVALLSGTASAAKRINAYNAPTSSDVTPGIEKSIRANFGGDFSVRTHAQSAGMTYADIEHVGNRYLVTSQDLRDWKIVSSARAL